LRSMPKAIKFLRTTPPPAADPADDDFPSKLQIFLGLEYGGPEQLSLTSWREHSSLEILAEYGCAQSSILYLSSGRFGPSFVLAFNNDPDANNLARLQDLFNASGYEITSTAQLIKDWVVALLAVGGEITNGAVVDSLPMDAI
jgi:hypothetical protein